MRRLKKNKQSLYYSTYKGKAAVKDDYDNETGEYVLTYNSPVLTSWNVSYVDSDAEVEMFGIEAKDVIRVVADKDFPLNEASILWFGITPHTPFAEAAPDHNYVIAGIRPSLNELMFYARKVDTFAAQPVAEEPEATP